MINERSQPLVKNIFRFSDLILVALFIGWAWGCGGWHYSALT